MRWFVLAIFTLRIICKQEFGCNHNKGMLQIPEVTCLSTRRTSMTLNITRREAILGHSVKKLLKLSVSSVTVWFFFNQDLSQQRSLDPCREKKGTAMARGAYLGARRGFSWLKCRQDWAHWEQNFTSVIDIPRRVFAGLPGAILDRRCAGAGGGPEGAVCRDGHGHVWSDLQGSGLELRCLYAGSQPEFEVCGPHGLSVSCLHPCARTHAPRWQYLKLWLITNTVICCLHWCLGSRRAAVSSAPLRLLVWPLSSWTQTLTWFMSIFPKSSPKPYAPCMAYSFSWT